MKSWMRSVVVASSMLGCGAFCGTASAAALQDSDAKLVSDARREAQILTGFGMNPHLREIPLSVHVDGNKAVLDGTVDSSVAKDLAEQIAQGADGISHVDDRIVVDADYVPPERVASTRTFGEVLDDATIAATVKYKLLWNTKTDALGVHVEARNGEVTLSGSVHTAYEKALVGRIARNTEGVLSVGNTLRIDPVKAAQAAPRASVDNREKPSDAWITTKVKSSLMFTRGTDVFGIRVSTHDAVVSLAGLVDTDEERDLAIEVAQDVRGVKSVSSADLTVGPKF